MRIAQIVCTYPPYFGGMGNSTFSLSESLAVLGHEVEVFTPIVDAPSLADTKAQVQRVAPRLQYGNGGFFPSIVRTLDTFDVVHLQYPFFGVAGAIRRWKLRHPDIPLVTTYHMDARGSGLLGMYMKLYARHYMPKMMECSDAVLTSSIDFAARSDAADVYANAKDKWHEVPFGVDTDRFHTDTASDALRMQLGAGTRPMLLFVGGMDSAHYFKGISYLLRAMRQVVMHTDALLVLVGDGNERSTYETEAALLGLKDHVHFAGAVSDAVLPAYYASADCTVLPSISRAEAFGMVLLESMASGTPVIASDLPGVRTVASLAGAVVPPKDMNALAQALGTAIAVPLLPADRAAVRSTVVERYSWQVIAQQTVDIYKQVLDIQ